VIHDQVAVGVGADQDLADDLVRIVTAAVEGAPEHGERNEAQSLFGHRWILDCPHHGSRYTLLAAATAAPRGPP
jgi:hypothetical protein